MVDFFFGILLGISFACIGFVVIYNLLYRAFIFNLLKILTSIENGKIEASSSPISSESFFAKKIKDKKQVLIYEKMISVFEHYSDTIQNLKFNLVQQDSTIESMFEFTDKFGKVSSSQSQATENVASNTEELRASFDNINSYAEKQVDHLSNVYSELNTFNLFMERLNTEMTVLSSDSKALSDRIHQGEFVVAKAKTAMKNIADSSSKIKEIAVNINEISDQTNLLALNASIEAARAGEKGRGFAVVAKEISKLSERTVKSVKEIEIFVKNTTREVQIGIETLQSTSEIITDMLKWIQKLEQFLNTNAKAIDSKAESANQISNELETVKLEAIEIKNASMEQTQAVEQINVKTQHISQESEGILMSSIELGALVDELKRITGILKATFV